MGCCGSQKGLGKVGQRAGVRREQAGGTVGEVGVWWWWTGVGCISGVNHSSLGDGTAVAVWAAAAR